MLMLPEALQTHRLLTSDICLEMHANLLKSVPDHPSLYEIEIHAVLTSLVGFQESATRVENGQLIQS